MERTLDFESNMSSLRHHLDLGNFKVGDVISTFGGKRLVSKKTNYHDSNRSAIEVFWPSTGETPLSFHRGWYCENIRKGEQRYDETSVSELGDQTYHVYAKIYRQNKHKLLSGDSN
jgi:hypothetical protein